MILGNLDAPALKQLLQIQVHAWPEHEKFLAARFATTDIDAAERVAKLVLKLSDDLAGLASDYRWMCDRMYEEGLHFKRTGSYRLMRFEDAVSEVYSNREFMRRYMNGLLISQVWWENHTRCIDYYSRDFLPQCKDGYKHLEVGPGHGLLLYFAGQDARASSVTGWDLSDSSLQATREALTRLTIPREIRLEKRNLFDAAPAHERFDSIVVSEVCEHLEDPESALVKLRDHLEPGGRLYVNFPVNSPAPDHIYLLRTPEEAVEMVQRCGYDVADQRFFPVTGYTEERARRNGLTISCIIVATVRP